MSAYPEPSAGSVYGDVRPEPREAPLPQALAMMERAAQELDKALSECLGRLDLLADQRDDPPSAEPSLSTIRQGNSRLALLLYEHVDLLEQMTRRVNMTRRHLEI